jgi:RHS repeat-associated protein
VQKFPIFIKPVLISQPVHSNKPTQVAFQNPSPVYTNDLFVQNYAYDGDKRLASVTSSPDGNIFQPEAAYTYYLHGPLKRTVLGKNIQGLDYTYTIEGWLKAINHPSLNNTYDPGHDGGSSAVSTDVFGMTLNYYNGDFSRSGSPFTNYILSNGNLYNGNIVSWEQSVGSLPSLGYKYRYDQLNRITGDVSYTSSNGTSWSADNKYNEGFGYDKNGNLTSVARNQNGTAMDNASYSLGTLTSGPSDQLASVSDAVSSTAGGSANIPGGTSTFTYDLSGRMTANVNSINHQYVTWRADGKVDNETLKNTSNTTLSTTQYLYDGMGNRAASIYAPTGGTAVTTSYINTADGKTLGVYQKTGTGAAVITERYLYGSERLATIGGVNAYITASPGGYWLGYSTVGGLNVWFNSLTGAITYINPYTGVSVYGIGPASSMGNTTTSGWGFSKRSYELHDHLGNVRAVVSDTKSGSNAVVKSYYNYYAFGGMIAGKTSDGSGYRYGFNGQERDDLLAGGTPGGVGVDYAFKFREFNASLGRFMSIDPLVKKYPWWTPYQFAGNMPIKYMDLEGLEPANNPANPANQDGRDPTCTINSLYSSSGGDDKFNKNYSSYAQGNNDENATVYGVTSKNGYTSDSKNGADKGNLWVNDKGVFKAKDYKGNFDTKDFANFLLGCMVKGVGPENMEFPTNGIVSNKLKGAGIVKDALSTFHKNNEGKSHPTGIIAEYSGNSHVWGV